jgi:hypothetical protein
MTGSEEGGEYKILFQAGGEIEWWAIVFLGRR